MKPDQERVKNLLSDTVTLLCKNGLTFQQELKVEGLIAITVDKNEFFVIHIDETTAGENAKTAGDSAADESESAAYHSEDSLDTGSQSPSRKRQRNSVERQNFHKTPQKASGQFSSPRPSPSHARRSTDRHRTNASSRLSNERHSTQGVEDTPDESRIPKLEDIKIKIEDEDVLILDEDDQQDQGRPDPSQRVPPTGHDDAEAMREGYSNMSMDSLQGEYPPYSQMSGNEGPPSKRRATSADGSGTDYYGEGGGDSNSNDSAFITGIVQNIFKQEPQSASWSEASASLGADPALQTGGAGDGQLPGCSSWQASPGGQYQQPSDMVQYASGEREWYLNALMKNGNARGIRWAYNIWKKWTFKQRVTNDMEIREITELSVEELNQHMTRFVQEIRKHDGSPYPPRSLQNICAWLVQYFHQFGRYDIGLMNSADSRFAEFRRALVTRIRELERSGYRLTAHTQRRIQTFCAFEKDL